MEKWHSVRCIFRHPKLEKSKEEFLYEERILLWKASDLKQAVEMAENEAHQYKESKECIYIGLAQGYHTYIDKPESGSEIFSLMRDDDSPPEEYIDLFFDTGGEKQKEY